MAETGATIRAPPGLEAPGAWDSLGGLDDLPPGLEAPSGWGSPGGFDPPPGLPMPPFMRPTGQEGLCAPPGLEKPAARRWSARAGRAKRESYSSSTSAASVTTEEPPSEEPALAHPAAGPGCSGHGLAEGAEEHPGQWPSYSATISGLPNDLLTEAMFGAVLEQAGLSHLVVGFTLHAGWPCGEARVSLISRFALEHCAQHFQGCQWDPSGALVTVTMDIQECREIAEWELAMAAYAGGERGFGLQVAAEAFSVGTQPVAMSCEAPVFVPSAGFGVRAASAVGAKGAEAGAPAALVTSDTSTEVGESEAEDERGPWRAQGLAAARVAPPARA